MDKIMDKTMDKITNQITMLGTGNATVSQIYNTCFLLQTPSSMMLVDAGGGTGCEESYSLSYGGEDAG